MQACLIAAEQRRLEWLRAEEERKAAREAIYAAKLMEVSVRDAFRIEAYQTLLEEVAQKRLEDQLAQEAVAKMVADQVIAEAEAQKAEAEA